MMPLTEEGLSELGSERMSPLWKNHSGTYNMDERGLASRLSHVWLWEGQWGQLAYQISGFNFRMCPREMTLNTTVGLEAGTWEEASL